MLLSVLHHSLPLSVLLPAHAWAQTLIPSSLTAPGGGCDFVTGEFDSSCIPAFIGYLIGVVFQFAAAIFVLVVMLGGYQYVLGSVGGDKEAGKARVKFGIAGFFVCALAYLIISFIFNALLGT